jgi:hypothetical protein
MTKSIFLATLSLIVCLVNWAPEANGQFRTEQDQIGLSGGQSSSGFGNSQSGNTGFGQQGSSAFGQQQGQASGQQFGQGQRTGGNQNGPGQNRTVGNDAESVRRSFENTSSRDRRGMMFDMALENLNEMREQRNDRNRQRRRPDPVRIQLRPTFNYQPPSGQQIAADLQSHLLRSEELTGIVAPRVEIVDRVATVSGFVPSEHERAVLAKMISMQPGISKVNNLLTVDPFAPATVQESEEASTTEPATQSSAD